MIQHVSNAGLILAEEGITIGIDCFSKDHAGLYSDTPKELRGKLLDAIEKKDIDLLIFTHEHEDHFCADDVKEALNRNPDLQIYSTKQVIHILKDLGVPPYSLFEIQRNEPPTWKEFGNMRVGFLYTQHEGTQYADVPNLTLLIEIGKKRLVITGDAMPTEALFAQIGAWSDNINGFFLPFPYVGLQSTRNLIAKHLHIDKIFVLHQPRKEADVQGWVRNAKRVCEQATDGLPMAFFPDRLGDWYWM